MNGTNTVPSLGVIFHPKFPPESLADYARRAEAGGFDELWLWDDCFTAGALTSAAIALAATTTLKVGIGLMPATAYNPLFTAMEITTLARAYPGRFLPGFGHGLDVWMHQIGAAPKSTMKSLAETVTAVRQLLQGEQVNTQGQQVKLDRVQLTMKPNVVPPLYVGGMREKTLELAGRVGDGTILTAMSSPAYVRWAAQKVAAGQAQGGRKQNNLVVYLDVKVSPDGEAARAATRKTLAGRIPWTDIQLEHLGAGEDEDSRADMTALLATHGAAGIDRAIPDGWLDALTACGTPDQVLGAIRRWYGSGAGTLVFQPLDADADGDPGALDEYIKYLMPGLKR